MEKLLVIKSTESLQVLNQCIIDLFTGTEQFSLDEFYTEEYKKAAAGEEGIFLCFVFDYPPINDRLRMYVTYFDDAVQIGNIVSAEKLDKGEQINANYYNIQQYIFDIINRYAYKYPQLELTLNTNLEWFETDALILLKIFGTTSNRDTLYNHPSDFEKWSAFVVFVFENRLKVDNRSFGEKITAMGWDNESTDELYYQLEYSLDLLRFYNDR